MQPLAARGAAVGVGYRRRGRSLVDEDKALGIEIGLRLEPSEAFPQEVRAVLLDGMPCLFYA